jgi:membrane protease YdiL (CAAX protease family)
LGLFSFALGVYFCIQAVTAPAADLGGRWMLAPSLWLLTVSVLPAFTDKPMTLHSSREFRITVLLAPIIGFLCIVVLGRPESFFPTEYVYVLNIAFIVPVAEEAFFRGILLDHLVRYNGKASALLLSSALFAVLHFSQGSFIQMLTLAVVLGVVTLKTRRIMWAIGVHVAWNIVSLIG